MIRGNYRRFSYFLFRWIDNKPRTGIEESLYKADILMLPGMYIGIIALTAIFASATTFVGSYFLFTDIIPSGSYSVYYMLAVTATTAQGA